MNFFPKEPVPPVTRMELLVNTVDSPVCCSFYLSADITNTFNGNAQFLRSLGLSCGGRVLRFQLELGSSRCKNGLGWFPAPA
jgi:hypothetical protein